jgi:hypothetical protein
MKSYTLNSKSWHFWLASEWGSRIYVGEGIDICSYIRRVISGFFKMIGAGIMAALFIGLILAGEGSFLYAAYQLTFGDINLITEAVGTLAAIAAALNVLLLIGAVKAWTEENDISLSVPTPGFISLAAKKFKSKTCFMINFKE